MGSAFSGNIINPFTEYARLPDPGGNAATPPTKQGNSNLLPDIRSESRRANALGDLRLSEVFQFGNWDQNTPMFWQIWVRADAPKPPNYSDDSAAFINWVKQYAPPGFYQTQGFDVFPIPENPNPPFGQVVQGKRPTNLPTAEEYVNAERSQKAAHLRNARNFGRRKWFR